MRCTLASCDRRILVDCSSCAHGFNKSREWNYGVGEKENLKQCAHVVHSYKCTTRADGAAEVRSINGRRTNDSKNDSRKTV